MKVLDHIPLTNLDLADITKYDSKGKSMFIMASRGCPYGCIYCNKSVFGKKVRFRKPEKILEEIKWLYNLYGITEIFFQDDTFNLRREWIDKILTLIIENGLNKNISYRAPFRANEKLVDEKLLSLAKEANFKTIFYGVENGNQDMLNRMHKGLTISEIKRAFKLTHDAGLDTIGAFIIGLPGETVETIKDSINLWKEIRPTHSGFTLATPFPNTQFENEVRESGHLVNSNYNDYYCGGSYVRTAKLTKNELKFYSSVATVGQVYEWVYKFPIFTIGKNWLLCGISLSLLRWARLSKQFFKIFKLRFCLSNPMQETTAPVKLRSRVAHNVWRNLLNSPVGARVEQALVWLGHLFPYHYLPSEGAAIAEISRRKIGQDLIATLADGVQIVVPAIPEGVGLYMKGGYEGAETVHLFQRFMKQGHVFFDVGANMGFFTFLGAKSCGSTGHVYAFEPQGNLTKYLERTVVLNKYGTRVTVACAAVSNDHGSQATLYYAANRDGTGIPSLFAHEWLDAASGMCVPTVSVDGYRQEKGIARVNVIKIDVEGAEMLVLRGMQHTLEETPPDLIVLEVLPATLSFRNIEKGAPLKQASMAATLENVVQFLTVYGYEPRRILRDGHLGRIYNHADLQSITWRTNIAFVSPRLKNTRPEVFAVNS